MIRSPNYRTDIAQVHYSTSVIQRVGGEKKSDWVRWDGYVCTKYGIVKIESSITPFWVKKKYKTSFMRIVWKGIEYNRTWIITKYTLQ